MFRFYHRYTYIHRKGLEGKTKVLTLAAVPVKPRIHSHLHFPHCHLGLPVETWTWGQLSLEAKKRSKCGLQIYVPLSFSGFPAWPTMRRSRTRNKGKAKMEEVSLCRRKRRTFKIFSTAGQKFLWGKDSQQHSGTTISFSRIVSEIGQWVSLGQGLLKSQVQCVLVESYSLKSSLTVLRQMASLSLQVIMHPSVFVLLNENKPMKHVSGT